MTRSPAGSVPGAAPTRSGLRARRLALALCCLGPVAARAQSESNCARDVLVANSMQRQAIEQLEVGGDDEAVRCRVWRRHVDTMRRLAGVYGRCLSGSERRQRLAEVQGSETEFAGLVRGRCRGQ